jgi:hypothetical protein
VGSSNIRNLSLTDTSDEPTGMVLRNAVCYIWSLSGHLLGTKMRKQTMFLREYSCVYSIE